MSGGLRVAEVRELVVRELPHWIREAPALRQQLTEALSEPAPRRKMTYEEFLEWCDEDTWAEWVDGEVIMLSPASPRHQDLNGFLEAILRPYVEIHGLGRVISAPFAMRLEHGREPDLLFVATEHLDRLYSGGLQGPADVVVEIVSQDSLERDRGAKFVEYEAGGVREYWLIDQIREWAECYRLGDEGRYGTIFAGREGVFRSQVITDFWLRVEWLWQESLPPTGEVLLEIGGESYARWLIQRLRQRGWLPGGE